MFSAILVSHDAETLALILKLKLKNLLLFYFLKSLKAIRFVWTRSTTTRVKASARL